MQISSTSVSRCLDNRSRLSVPAAFRQRPRLSRRILFLLLGLLVAGLLGGSSAARAQSETARPVQAQDLYRMQEVRDVVLSPHGRSVAYTVRRVVSASRQPARAAPAHRTRLYVTPTSGRRAPTLLVRKGGTIRQPTWHPDGTQLAFVRRVNGTPQVFVVPLRGGGPYQLTDVPWGAQRPQWSPDGERLLFASAVPESALERRMGRPAPSERPGRTPQDPVRTVPPDTILVLRHTQTLTPMDTLAVGPEGLRAPPRPPTDTTRHTLRTPGGPSVPDSLAAQPVDRLVALSPDSLRAVFDSLRLRPDTMTVPVAPDTATAPSGNLVQVRRWLHQNRNSETARVSSRLDVQGERRLQPSPTYRHHFVVEVPSGIGVGTPPRPEVQPVTTGYRSYGRAEWLPGSGQILVSGTPRTSRHPDRVQRHNLYVVDLTRSQVRRLLHIENHALTAPTVTADGTTIAFRARALSDTSDEQAEIGLFALDGRSKPRLITSTFDRDVASVRWSPNGWYLYATAASGRERPLYRFTPFGPDTARAGSQERRPTMSADQPTSRNTFGLDSTMVRPAPVEQMTADGRAVHAFDVTDATAVYAATDSATPSGLYTNTVSFNSEQRLAAPNADWLSRRRLATPERLTAVQDSLEVTGWVTRPSSSPDSLRPPLLVTVRGGPPALSVPTSPETWFERQYLAARGLGVVEVWPRGSAGFGTAFRRANDRNWGPGPAQDVLALTDSAAALPWTDSTQVALIGTSYGATLATWLLGQTDRYDAAVALNGVYDLPALLDGGAAWRLVPQEFGGYPWRGARALPAGPPTLSVGLLPTAQQPGAPRAALHRSSPITYADQIDTPLLLLQGGTDRRVGSSQGERLYKRLKILERPVEYVRYPGVGHDVAASATPRQRVDRLVRTYEFLARFLDVPAASAPPDETAPVLP